MRLDLKKLGQRIARIDRHLMKVLGLRVGNNGISAAVAESKRHQHITKGGTFPIRRKSIEDERLAAAAAWATEQGVDPDFATGVIYGIIAESSRVQADFMHNHRQDPDLDESDPVAVAKYHRKQLLRLTRAVAPRYEAMYGQSSFATKLHQEFELFAITRTVQQCESRALLIDLGCATGIGSRPWSGSFMSTTGYDVSPAMIKVANTYKDRKTSFELHDLEDGIPVDSGTVSMILMNLGTASDICNINRLLREVNRTLSPRGRFVLSFYNSQSLLNRVGFLPWSPSLAAHHDHDRNCLEVQYRGKHFFVHARAYSPNEVRAMMEQAGLKIESLATHPTISPVLPDDILSTEIFQGFGKTQQGRRWRPARLENQPSPAQELLARLDTELAHSPQEAGAYIVVTGTKS